MNWLGVDIGGANLKVADGERFAAAGPFPLWKQPSGLAAAIRRQLDESPPADGLAVTMTGELADCFATKTAGVRFILAAVQAASAGRQICVYQTDGRFVTAAAAQESPWLAAASNWHAVARFAGRYVPAGAALVLDIGSTTCDVIPLLDGVPRTLGRTDTSRLVQGELVYTGVERSPVCAVLDRVPYRGQMCPVAQELFATARDAYLVLEALPEQPCDLDTADGRPATKAAALVRLGRMVCADSEEFQERDGVALASAVVEAQTARVAAAVQQVCRRAGSPSAVILAGHGDFLARRVLVECGLRVPAISLADRLGSRLSRCATAHAVAVLARETLAC